MHDHPSDSPDLADHPRLVGISVLVAEDNDINQMVLEDMLLSEGARLEIVANGRAAVTRVAEAGANAFQVVLMDIQMPEMDGYEATRSIKAGAPRLPIIGQTAHTTAEEIARCRAAGMVDHVAKPIDLDVLVATILKHVRQPPEQTGMINWPDLEARYANKPEFIRKLLGIFATSQTPMLDELRAATLNGDFDSLVRLAHALKGSSGNIMAHDLMALALATEHAARDKNPESATLAGDLANGLAATLAEIARRLEG